MQPQSDRVVAGSIPQKLVLLQQQTNKTRRRRRCSATHRRCWIRPFQVSELLFSTKSMTADTMALSVFSYVDDNTTNWCPSLVGRRVPKHEFGTTGLESPELHRCNAPSLFARKSASAVATVASVPHAARSSGTLNSVVAVGSLARPLFYLVKVVKPVVKPRKHIKESCE